MGVKRHCENRCDDTSKGCFAVSRPDTHTTKKKKYAGEGIGAVGQQGPDFLTQGLRRRQRGAR